MLKIIISVSKKDINRKTIALVYDLGYARKYLSFNLQDIAEIYGVSVRELVSYDCGEYIIK